MNIKARDIYKIVQDSREIQERNFYNLPLNVILILQNNFSIINNLYSIIKQTEQVILERNNYQNYEEELEKLMNSFFIINPTFFEYSDIINIDIPISTASTIMLFAKEEK